MSNDRSPREVCSITIGINGLMSGWLLATGGPQFRLRLGFFLVWRPDALARLGLLGWNALDFSRDPVESAGQAHRLTLRLVRARSSRLLDHLFGLFEAVAEGLVDLLVAHLDAQLIRGRLEQELAGDGGSRLVAEAYDEVVGRVAGELEVRLEGASASLHHGVELTKQRARACLDERPRDLHVRRLDELGEQLAPKGLVHFRLDLRTQTLFDVRA